MHSLLHDIPRFLILFILIFNKMLSIPVFGRRDLTMHLNSYVYKCLYINIIYH